MLFSIVDAPATFASPPEKWKTIDIGSALKIISKLVHLHMQCKRVGDIKISILSVGLVEKQNQDDTRLMMNAWNNDDASSKLD